MPAMNAARAALIAVCIAVALAGNAHADSSTPALAAYYDRQMAICGGDAYEWTGDQTPRKALPGVIAVGVGRNASYALARDGRLFGWRDDPRAAIVLIDGVRAFAAGDSGALAIRTDNSLWLLERSDGGLPGRPAANSVPIATGVAAASVGDGTNYHVTANGDLYARGNAHRGQYGDGRLERADAYVRVATGVVDVKSHTGHALLRDAGGDVQGTGGNIYGPLARHGLGDKAVRWATIFTGATGIATGASHSLAIAADGALWSWGRNAGPDPRPVLADVAGVAAGTDISIALTRDGALWQWSPGKQPRKIFECGPNGRSPG
jgi:alpha-tubulin suppressor-like RCC1 family protein